MSLIQEIADKVGDVNQPLSNTGLLSQPQFWNSNDIQTLNWEFGPGLSLGVDAYFGIALFNSTDDQDKDGVYGKRKQNSPQDESIFNPLEVKPLIEPQDGQAWLKYILGANAKAGANLEFPYVGVDASANGNARLAFYRRFPADTTLTNAAIDSVADLIGAVPDVDQIVLAGDGEATLYKVHGDLQAAVTLSYSDSFTFLASGLRNILGENVELVSGTFSAEAKVTFKVAISDDFQVVFLGLPGNKIDVAVSKASSKEFGINASASATLMDLDYNKEALGKAFDGIIEGIFSQISLPAEAATATKFLEKLKGYIESYEADPTQDLPEAYKQIVDQILELLGINNIVGAIGLDDELDDVEESIDDVLEILDDPAKVVLAKLESVKTLVLDNLPKQIGASVTYSYNRMEKDHQILHAELTHDAVKRHAGDLFLLDLSGLLADAAAAEDGAANGVTLKSYFHQKSVTESYSFAWVAGAAGFFQVGQSWATSNTWVTRTIGLGQHARVINGFQGKRVTARKDQTREGFTDASFTLDFTAQMKDAKPQQAVSPLLSDYEFELVTTYESVEADLIGSLFSSKQDQLLKFIDAAIITGVLKQGNVKEHLRQLTAAQPDLIKLDEVKVVCQATYPHELVLELAELIVIANTDTLARALSKAVLCWPAYHLRCDPLFREQAYKKGMLHYLKNGDGSLKKFGGMFAEGIRELNNPDYAPGDREKLAIHEATGEASSTSHHHHNNAPSFRNIKHAAAMIHYCSGQINIFGLESYNIKNCIKDLLYGCRTINNAANLPGDKAVIKNLNDELNGLAKNLYGARFFVSLLSNIVRDHQLDESKIKKTFKFTGKLDGKAHEIVVA